MVREVIRLEKRLCDIGYGESAVIKDVLLEGSIGRRLYDIGFIEGTDIECVGKSLFGGMTAFLVRGAVYALRTGECEKIFIY